MDKKMLSEKDGIHENWYHEVKKITEDKLLGFIDGIDQQYDLDSKMLIHYYVASMMAVAKVLNDKKQGKLTTNQYRMIFWEFVARWYDEYYGHPLKLIDYHDMLFPHYGEMFMTIDEPTFKWVQEQAGFILENLDSVEKYPDWKEHLTKIVKGEIPFGLNLLKDEEVDNVPRETLKNKSNKNKGRKKKC